MENKTWVYANRVYYDQDQVHQRALEMMEIEKENEIKLFSFHEELVESDEKRSKMSQLMAELDLFYSRLQAYPEWNDDKKRFVLSQNERLNDIYGQIPYLYAEFTYYIANIHHSSQYNNLQEILPLIKKQLEIQKSIDIDDIFTADIFLESAICDIYNLQWLDAYIDIDQGFYALETEFIDVFKMVDGFTKDIFYSRDELEQYIFNKNTDDVSVYEYTTGKGRTIEDQYIKKSDQYDLFVSNCTQILNVVYEKHPDALIQLG